MYFIKGDVPAVTSGLSNAYPPGVGHTRTLVGRHYRVRGRALKRESGRWVLVLALPMVLGDPVQVTCSL